MSKAKRESAFDRFIERFDRLRSSGDLSSFQRMLRPLDPRDLAALRFLVDDRVGHIETVLDDLGLSQRQKPLVVRAASGARLNQHDRLELCGAIRIAYQKAWRPL